jgi:hypothetical protein
MQYVSDNDYLDLKNLLDDNCLDGEYAIELLIQEYNQNNKLSEELINKLIIEYSNDSNQESTTVNDEYYARLLHREYSNPLDKYNALIRDK